MPAWLLRLVWKVRGKRIVRLHPSEEGKPTIEGVRIGHWNGMHVLIMARLLLTEVDSVTLEGVTEVMDARVLFCQVLS